MITLSRETTALYVDHATQQWILRDLDGSFWTVGSGDDAWSQRQPFEISDDTNLEPVPGHYKYLLDLPF
jgi:hypothetical protein